MILTRLIRRKADYAQERESIPTAVGVIPFAVEVILNQFLIDSGAKMLYDSLLTTPCGQNFAVIISRPHD